MSACRVSTPWGESQEYREIAPGIAWVSTSSHGGFRLSMSRLAEMPRELRAITPFAGVGWYEEDCDWSIVALAFPQFFPVADVEVARATFKHWHPGVLIQSEVVL